MWRKIDSIYAPIIIWLVVKTGLFIHLGTVIANDSPRYIKYANHLLRGGKVVGDFDSNYIFYSVIIAFFHKTGIGIGGVVLLQIFFSGLSCYFLYQMALSLFGKKECGVITIIVYSGWIFAQQWDFYILTDSLFTSFCVWIAYLVVCYKGKSKEALIFTLIIFLFTLRPNGFVMGVAFIGYLLNQLFEKNRWLFWKVVSCMPILFLFLIYYLNGALKSYFPSLIYGNYLEGEIISGYEGFLLNTEDVEFPDPNGEPMLEMIAFAFHNPFFALKMIFYKVFFFFGHIRPFYSQSHNIIIMIVLYPSYLFSIITVRRYKIEQSAKVFISTFILSQAAVVALYMEDWDGRFLLPVIPFVFLLASPQISSFFNIDLSKNRLATGDGALK